MLKDQLVGLVASASTLVLVPMFAAAQVPLTITPSFVGNSSVAPTTAIELRLSQPLPAADGHLVVFIGTTDVTALFTTSPDKLVYQPSLLTLPLGKNEVTVSLVSTGDNWKDAGHFPLQVAVPNAVLLSEFGVGVDMDLKGQAAEGHASLIDSPVRSQFQDLAFNIHEHSAHVTTRAGIRTQANLLAVTHHPEALRYRELGADAPDIDLSDYLISGEGGHTRLSLGNISFGSNRLLLNNFASRGITASQGIGPARVALAAMNATSIVGWDNPVGVSNDKHRLVAAEFGIEALPSRPGALGLQLSLLDGAQLPTLGYSQGAVTDAEESRGVGLHLSASDALQRVRVDAGYARSEFTNPDNPLLSPGYTLVKVIRAARNARYADLTLDVLRSLAVPQTVAATLQTTFRHERVDPLYHSVAGTTRSDFIQNGIDLVAGVGPVSAQGSYSRGNDNLSNVISLLKLLTRTTAANLALPLAPLLKEPSSPWLPVLSYRYNQIHQLGDHLPPNSGFTLGDVPDLASTNHGLGVEWSSSRWHAGYQLSRTLQDNRQIGHETEDFTSLTHTASVGARPANAVDLSIEFAFEHTHNEAMQQDFHTRRVSGLANWHITRTTALGLIGSANRTADDGNTSEQKNTDLQVELSQRIALMRIASLKPSGQLFVRYTRRTGDVLIPGVSAIDPRRNWSFNTGVSFSVR